MKRRPYSPHPNVLAVSSVNLAIPFELLLTWCCSQATWAGNQESFSSGCKLIVEQYTVSIFTPASLKLHCLSGLLAAATHQMGAIWNFKTLSNINLFLLFLLTNCLFALTHMLVHKMYKTIFYILKFPLNNLNLTLHTMKTFQ